NRRLLRKGGTVMRSAISLAVMATAALFTAIPLAAQDSAVRSDAADALYCEERKLGYWFYCVRPGPEPRTTAPQPDAPTSAAEELDAITRRLRELKAQAILHPTPENVAAYIRLQREQLDRASLFSVVWQRALWQDPELDYTLERPVG